MSAYDVIVVGAGPGGYVAAIRAAQLGLRAAIVERSHLGGICLNWGCIPTKSLLHSAELLDHARHSAGFGIETGQPVANMAAIVARSRGVASQLNAGVQFLLRKNKVDVLGHGGNPRTRPRHRFRCALAGAERHVATR